MTKIRFSNGVVVNFNGDPSQADIEEASQHALQAKPIQQSQQPQSVQPAQPEKSFGDTADEYAMKAADILGVKPLGEAIALGGMGIVGDITGNKELQAKTAKAMESGPTPGQVGWSALNTALLLGSGGLTSAVGKGATMAGNLATKGSLASKALTLGAGALGTGAETALGFAGQAGAAGESPEEIAKQAKTGFMFGAGADLALPLVAKAVGGAGGVLKKALRPAEEELAPVLEKEMQAGGGKLLSAFGKSKEAITSPIKTLGKVSDAYDSVIEKATRKIVASADKDLTKLSRQAIKPTKGMTNKTLEGVDESIKVLNDQLVSKGYKPQNMVEYRDLTKKELNDFWQENIESKIKNAPDAEVDMTPIANTIRKKAQSPAIKAMGQDSKLLALADSIEASPRMKMADAEELKQMLNAEATWGTASKDTVLNSAYKDASRIIGDQQDQLLSTLPGEFKTAKRKWGQMREAYDHINHRANVVQRQAPVGLAEGVSKAEGVGRALMGALRLSPAETAGGLAQAALGKSMRYLNDSDFMIKTVFDELEKNAAKKVVPKIAPEEGKLINQLKKNSEIPKVGNEAVLSNTQPGMLQQSSYGMVAGMQPQTDENGNVIGVGFDPKMAGLGMLGAGIVGKVGGKIHPQDEAALSEFIDAVRLKDQKYLQQKGTLQAEHIFDKLGISRDQSLNKLADKAEDILAGKIDTSSMYKTGREIKKDEKLLLNESAEKTADKFFENANENYNKYLRNEGLGSIKDPKTIDWKSIQGHERSGYLLPDDALDFLDNYTRGIKNKLPSEDTEMVLSFFRPKEPVKLYRGQLPGQPSNAVNSWTYNKDLAKGFAGKDGEIFEAVVDPNDIIFDSMNAPSEIRFSLMNPREQEVLVKNSVKGKKIK